MTVIGKSINDYLIVKISEFDLRNLSTSVRQAGEIITSRSEAIIGKSVNGDLIVELSDSDLRSLSTTVRQAGSGPFPRPGRSLKHLGRQARFRTTFDFAQAPASPPSSQSRR